MALEKRQNFDVLTVFFFKFFDYLEKYSLNSETLDSKDFMGCGKLRALTVTLNCLTQKSMALEKVKLSKL